MLDVTEVQREGVGGLACVSCREPYDLLEITVVTAHRKAEPVSPLAKAIGEPIPSIMVVCKKCATKLRQLLNVYISYS